MTTKKKRTVGLLSIVIIIAAALVIALWVVPFAQMASYRGSETVQAHAAQLVADYEAETGETVSQEDVCRDMSYLDRLWIYEGTLPTEITGTREGRLVYAMPFTDTETEYIDVYRTGGGTIHYFVQSDDGSGESNLELKPWGTLYADGMKIS